ncbi:hypothetical protein GCM10010421_31970 [Streptomyces glaucus]|uniref:Uncharacterized protein n=1 Tax=Streptomyces glaucus TaxID=284029 RepID=A0ABN3JSP1_9ACTN
MSVLDDALAEARAAAQTVLSLVSATLHAQFPTAAYLVLTRSPYLSECDELSLDSVRDAHGGILRDFADGPRAMEQLPAVPQEIAGLWGTADPRNPHEVLELLQRIEDTAPRDLLLFLPPEVMHDGEENAERTPLGIPLRSASCPLHGAPCEPDDHIEPPTVRGEAL